MRLLTFLRSPFGTALRYVVSIGALAWLAAQVDWSDIGRLRGLDPQYVVPAVLLAGIAYPLQAFRWQLLLRAQGITPPTTHLHGAFWVAQFYNSFLPGGVAGDAVRFAWLWRVAPDRKADAAASLLADRLLGLAALLALATVGLGLHLASHDGDPNLETLLSASIVALGFLAVLMWSLTRTRRWQAFAGKIIGAERASQAQDAIARLGNEHVTLAAGAAISIAVWLIDFISLGLLGRAVGLAAGPLEIAVAAAAAYVAAALPISIGGHGVREGALVAVLVMFGIGSSQPAELALLALAFWAVSVLWSLVGGLVQLSSLVAGWPLPRGSARA